MLKALQKRMNRLDFIRRVDVEHAGKHRGLIGDDADGAAEDAGEADNHVHGIAGLHLQEVAPVDDPTYHLPDVVTLLGLGRDDPG